MNTESNERLFLEFVRRLAHIGYGRMMQIISHEWYRHDPSGAQIGGDTVAAFLTKEERRQLEALIAEDPLFRHDQRSSTTEP